MCTHTSSHYAHARLPEDGGVDDVGSVGGSDDEHILLTAHAVHLCENLVDDPVTGASSISGGPATRLGNTVQLVEEEHTRRRRTSLEHN